MSGRGPKLIYCADGNKRFAQIALDSGFLYGSQMPRTCYYPPFFIDVNPNNLPKQPVYIARLRKFRPVMASVHDWSEEHRFLEIMMRAEEVAQYTDNVLIIPKVPGGVKRLPRTLGGKRVILGYSVPTSHGATEVDLNEFAGWPIHILGGSPTKQMALYRKMSAFAEVVSIDGNYHLKMARFYNQFFIADGSARYARNRYWPTLREAGGGVSWGDGSATADAPYEAFRRSCENIMEMWKEYLNCEIQTV